MNKTSKSLLLFFDGTGLKNKGALYTLFNGVVNDPSRNQLAYYVPGVEMMDGEGVRTQALDGYHFLVREFTPGDRVFIFGLSRGCLEGRMVQGLMHKYGILKRNAHDQPSQAELEDADLFEQYLRHHDSWHDVDIPVLGCIDGVLNTLGREDIGYMHQEITPPVRNFLHALAIQETSSAVVVAEVLVPKGTHEEQVWFQGDHLGICEDSLAAGWLGERAQELGGILLQEGFLGSINYQFTMLDERTDADEVTIRNPLMCRQEVYGGRPVKLHASIKDRMDTVRGWEPTTTCCHPEVFEDENVEWVSTPAYNKYRDQWNVLPQWLKVTARFNNITEQEKLEENLHVVLQSKGGTLRLAGIKEYKKKVLSQGAIFQDVFAFPHDEWEYYLSVVTGPCRSLLECGFDSVHHSGSDYTLVDQLRIGPELLSEISLPGKMQDASIANGKLLVTLEPLFDDVNAGAILNTTRPRCSWIKRFLEPGSDICTAHSWMYPKNCPDLQSQATNGNLHSGVLHPPGSGHAPQVTNGNLHSGSVPSALGSSVLLVTSILLAVGLL